MDEMSQQEVATLSTFCELSDPELPLYLLRYVCLFCKSGGIFAMAECFEEGVQLEVGVAQAIIAIVCNLKVWLNYRSVAQLFVPLRSRVLRYLCNLSDKDLRLPAVKNMSGNELSESLPISRANLGFFLRFHVGFHEGSHGVGSAVRQRGAGSCLQVLYELHFDDATGRHSPHQCPH
jgi:hypothetical protein